MDWLEDDFQLVPLRRKRRVEDAIPEDEKDSMLRELAQRGASGLSAVGWLLDTPGAIVRGLLSEGPMKGLSALWETSDERVTGRELLRDYGLVSDEDNYGNFGGGLATEILLDPLTYASFGLAPLLGGAAKTAAGRAASKAGLLTDDLGLLAREASKRSGKEIGRNQLLRQSPSELIDLLPANLQADARDRFLRAAGDRADDLLGQSLTASNRSLASGAWTFTERAAATGSPGGRTALATRSNTDASLAQPSGPPRPCSTPSSWASATRLIGGWQGN